MAIQPTPRGRKRRLVRKGETPDDVLLVRATPFDRERAIAAMVEDAQLSARHYVVETESGSQEVLYGISVFARRPNAGVATVLDRFTQAAAYIEVAIERLRAAGFVTYATGVDPDHFDIQLIKGLREDGPSASFEEVREAVARVLALGGPLQQNPAYSGGTLEEDR